MPAWAPSDPAAQFRLNVLSAPAPATADTALNSVASPSLDGAALLKPWSRDNPLLALTLLGAVTLGLVAFSTSGSVRLGKATSGVSLNVGSTK